eukprot:Ihof_evm4s619 gene=Ihof_evmTU4s619
MFCLSPFIHNITRCSVGIVAPTTIHCRKNSFLVALLGGKEEMEGIAAVQIRKEERRTLLVKTAQMALQLNQRTAILPETFSLGDVNRAIGLYGQLGLSEKEIFDKVL